MMTNDFEEAFGNFLERREYDEAENALFSMVRTAFVAGWKAAGGEPPKAQKLFELIRREDVPKEGAETDSHE